MGYDNYKKIHQRQFIRYENVFSINTLKEVENISKNQTPINDTGNDKQYQRKTAEIPIKTLPSSFKDNLDYSISNANKIFGMNFKSLELVYAEYYQNQSGLGWHPDIGQYPSNLRKLSFSINLNSPNEYEGGDLEFYDSLNTVNKSSKLIGGITIFPCFLIHRVTLVTKGIRKVVIGTLLGPPYK